MRKEITLILDTDVYEKFCMASKLADEDVNDVVESFMRTYIARTFGKISQEYSSGVSRKITADTDSEFAGKALQKIPIWALKPNQYNHRIIRAFFEAEEAAGEVTLDTMELLCSNKKRFELYVPTFKNNYAQMKIDGPKSYGKVFEDDGEHVWIWSEVEEVLRRYKDSFLRR